MENMIPKPRFTEGDNGRRADAMDTNLFTIGELARDFDVTLRTLRFYEDKGLIHPQRRGTTRLYTRRDRGRLQLILMGKRVGFSLDDIREMLDLYDLRDDQVTQLTHSIPRFRDQIKILEEQRNQIDVAIGELTGACDNAEQMLAQRTGKSA